LIQQNIIYKVKSGSQLYGTSTPESDTDYTSIFIPSAYNLLSLQKCDFVDMSSKGAKEYRRNTNQDFDDQSHSLSRYLQLVLKGNPNLTEILFAPKEIIEIENPIFTELKRNYSKLLSRLVYDSFVGFATSQRKKLEYKRIRYGELQSTLQYLQEVCGNQLEDNRTKMNERTATHLNTLLQHYKGAKNNVEHFHIGLPLKIIYEKIKSEYENYGWRLHTKSFKILGYDTKFASHTIRLLYEGEQLLLNGKLEYPLSGKVYNDIMNIKNGKLSIEEFQQLAYNYENKCREALINTNLSKKPNYKYANEYLVSVLSQSIIKEYYDS
jgi:uncharacterized protein